MSTAPADHGARRASRALPALALLVLSAFLPGCYSTPLLRLQGGLDSLRAVVDTMSARDAVTAQVIADTRSELAEQRDLLHATRATTSSTSREMSETLGRLESKLDDIMARFRIVSERTGPGAPAATPPSTGPPGVAAPDPTQLYDQATQDLTQGRYGLALQAYRDFLRRFPDSELADNAQYGAGECFFAQAQFDSAVVEYGRVDARWPKGDRAAAALYKLALSQERLGRAAESRRTLDDLVKRFPQSGEAQLARDRIGTSNR